MHLEIVYTLLAAPSRRCQRSFHPEGVSHDDGGSRGGAPCAAQKGQERGGSERGRGLLGVWMAAGGVCVWWWGGVDARRRRREQGAAAAAPCRALLGRWG